MSIPPKIPPRAPAMVEQVKAAEAVLAALAAETPRLALAKAELQPGAHKAYTEHEAKVAAARLDLDAKIGAAEAAAELDRQAAIDRRLMIRNADPDDLLEGISALDCCEGCSESECLLLGGLPRCGHPNKGNLPPELMNDQTIRRLRTIAIAEIKALERDDDEEDDEEEAA
ncbi:hypothetical protein [Bradyrhizobium sp. RT7b]|uniref:hypothetical protein n=1 Tax=unclassified Bradyrhizobium TaxID=2631580 RepID=UPI0033968E8C